MEIRRFRESLVSVPSRGISRRIPSRRSPLPRRQSAATQQDAFAVVCQDLLGAFDINGIGVLDHPGDAGLGVLGRVDEEPQQEKEVIMGVIPSPSTTGRKPPWAELPPFLLAILILTSGCACWSVNRLPLQWLD